MIPIFSQLPRLRPLRRLRGIFLMGAATPPLPRRGLRLSRRLSQTPVSSGRLVGNAQAVMQGGEFGLTFRFHDLPADEA